MSGVLALDWAILALSLFNAILLLWLGLTVLLNPSRRSWGIWLAAGGLLLGAVFFISHTAILGYEKSVPGPGLNFWWHVGWAPAVALPLAWYVVMLWYTGYWERGDASLAAGQGLYRRHRVWFAGILALAVGLVGLLWFANPLPLLTQLAQNNLDNSLTFAGIPALILVYPVYALLCFALAMDALGHPDQSGRWMGDLARSHARRWFSAASLGLLGVSILVGWAMQWIIQNVSQGIFTPRVFSVVARFDLVIAALIAFSVLLVGQAVMTYEVFTGKNLPRRGLVQYWRRAVILAGGYSLMVAGSIALDLRPVYSLLLTLVLMTVFFALLSWRSYAERERLFDTMRPFVASQRLYENILSPDVSAGEGRPSALPPGDLSHLFQALCKEVLETRRACLISFSMLAPASRLLVAYPENMVLDLPALEQLRGQFRSSQVMILPLDAAQSQGMELAIPLRRENGLAGLLLLGQKRGGGLYTLEEIEIGRMAGERLVDTQASAEIARRLVALQRQRLAQSQVLDRRARQTLHDDILPLVHTAMLELSAGNGAAGQANAPAMQLLAEIHHQLSDLLRAMPGNAAPDVARLGLPGALRRTLDSELSGAFDGVTWQVQPETEQETAEMPLFMREVLYYAAREAMRNAARYARREGQPLQLSVTLTCLPGSLPGLRLTVEDNGVGFQAAPDPGETDHGGSGQGLALHSTLMAVIGGTLSVESFPGEFTRVSLDLPQAAWKAD